MGVDFYTLSSRTIKVNIPENGIIDVHLLAYCTKMGGWPEDELRQSNGEERAYAAMTLKKSDFFVVCSDFKGRNVVEESCVYEGLIPTWTDCDPIKSKLVGFLGEKSNDVWTLKNETEWINIGSGKRMRDVVVDGKISRQVDQA